MRAPEIPPSLSTPPERGLGNTHYVDQATHELERQLLLFDQWAGIGFTSDVPQPGDVKPIDFIGMPLLLVRDHDGELGLFQNTCRHRGMILVSEATHIRRVIRCPYHSWCYDLAGELQATPHVGGPGRNTHDSIRLNDLGLIRIPAAEFLGVVFANISGTAPPFDQATEALKGRWSDFNQPVFSGTESSRTLDVRTNWKLAVENFCESYHLPWIHPGLNAYSRLADHYNIDDNPAFSGQGTRVYRQLADTQGMRLPDFNGIGSAWDTAGEYIALFPNVLLGVHRDHCYAMVLEPAAQDRTLEHLRLFYTEEAATEPRFESLRRENLRLWCVVFDEDVSVVEGMQRGRQGIHFDGGHFSPVMDASTAVFHRWVARTMEHTRGTAHSNTQALVDARSP